MKKIIKIQFLFISIFFLLIPVVIYSVSLGSFIRKNSVTATAGEKVRFEILFWNLGDPYNLRISEKSIPPDWKVSITPNNLLLDTVEVSKPPFDDGEYINLPNIGTIKPQRIRIDIQTRKDTKRGYYDVLLVASTSDTNKGISVSQQRDINFQIKIVNNQDEEQILDEKEDTQKDGSFGFKEKTNPEIVEENDNKSEENTMKNEVNNQEEQNKNPLTGRLINTLSNTLKNQNLIILFGIIFTILGCLVIYKYV